MSGEVTPRFELVPRVNSEASSRFTERRETLPLLDSEVLLGFSKLFFTDFDRMLDDLLLSHLLNGPEVRRVNEDETQTSIELSLDREAAERAQVSLKSRELVVLVPPKDESDLVTRSFSFGFTFPVNVDEATATYVDGVLRVVAPRAEVKTPRRVTVEVK